MKGMFILWYNFDESILRFFPEYRENAGSRKRVASIIYLITKKSML